MKILRLDMRTGNSSYEDADETYPMLGGRGLIAALLLMQSTPFRAKNSKKPFSKRLPLLFSFISLCYYKM